MSLVDADGGAEVGDDCSHPLLEAKTPRELALLVKHYRLLQVTMSQTRSLVHGVNFLVTYWAE